MNKRLHVISEATLHLHTKPIDSLLSHAIHRSMQYSAFSERCGSTANEGRYSENFQFEESSCKVKRILVFSENCMKLENMRTPECTAEEDSKRSARAHAVR